jgi:hypothetical protein
MSQADGPFGSHSSRKALESSTKTLAISAPFSLLRLTKLALSNHNNRRAGTNFLIYRSVLRAQLKMTGRTFKQTRNIFHSIAIVL